MTLFVINDFYTSYIVVSTVKLHQYGRFCGTNANFLCGEPIIFTALHAEGQSELCGAGDTMSADGRKQVRFTRYSQALPHAPSTCAPCSARLQALEPLTEKEAKLVLETWEVIKGVGLEAAGVILFTRFAHTIQFAFKASSFQEAVYLVCLCACAGCSRPTRRLSHSSRFSKRTLRSLETIRACESTV